MTVRDVQSQMEAKLERWYGTDRPMTTKGLCRLKVREEFEEWDRPGEYTPEEAADVVIALCGWASQAGIDLQSEIERKLAIVSARDDQAERDRERGIG